MLDAFEPCVCCELWPPRGLKVDWAYSPGQVKILTSSDGANFEEAKCWQASTRSEVAYEEAFMFDTARTVKAVTIVMRTPQGAQLCQGVGWLLGLFGMLLGCPCVVALRSPQSWGYFGINSAALIAEPGPFMLTRWGG